MDEPTPLAMILCGGAVAVWVLSHAARTGKMPIGSLGLFDVNREKYPIVFWSLAALWVIFLLAMLYELTARMSGS